MRDARAFLETHNPTSKNFRPTSARHLVRRPSLPPNRWKNRAASKSNKGGGSAEGKGEPLSCSVCKQQLPAASFTNTQARKPDASRKCRECSAAAEAAEAEASRVARAAKMSDAQAASAAAASLPKGAAGAAARLKGKVRLPVVSLFACACTLVEKLCAFMLHAL